MAYLSNEDYLLRFGNAETIRLTDETKTGTVDQAEVSKAIADASQFADSYLGTRYALPIASPPPILEGIVAVLAREYLHKQKPTLAVTEAADRARTQLRDLSAGRAVIPVDAGDLPPTENPTGEPVTAGDARPRVFSDGALCDFTSLGYSPPRTFFNGPRW